MSGWAEGKRESLKGGFAEPELVLTFCTVSITLYKQAIQMAAKEADYTTRRLLEEILAEEENHINTFGKLLVGMTEPFTQPGISKVE